MKKTLKLTAIILVFCLIAQLFTVCAIAETNGNTQTDVIASQQEKPYIVAEIEQERKENEKHFLLSNGKYLAASYMYPVHYLDDEGKWQDIDNELKAADADDYQVSSSAYVTKLSKKLKKDRTVELNANGNKITWGYSDSNKSDAVVISDPQREGDDVYLSLDKTVSDTMYYNAFNNVDLQYLITPIGVKENIILKNKLAQNVFNIEYKYTNLDAVLVNSKTIQLKNADGEIVYTISAPIMTDASGNISTDITLEIVEEKSNHLTVKLTADEQWLKSTSRAYPVYIDPEVSSIGISTVQSGASSGDDVSEQDGIYVGTHNYAGFPIDNMGVVRLSNLPSLGSGGYVTHAEFSMSCMSFGNSVGVYFAENVTDITTLDWADLTSITSGNADDITNTTTPENFYNVATWDITRAAQKNYRKGLTFVLKSMDGTLSQFQTNTPFTAPHITVTYVNQNGISDKFSYHTQSVGRAGTAYINDLTGRLNISRTDLSYPSEKMGVSVGMNYVPNFREALAYGVATSDDTFNFSWRNSYFEYLDTGISNSAVYAVWQRADGTNIYFSSTQTTPEEGAAYYPAMDGYGYKLYTTHIEDESGTRYIFDNNHRLTKIQNGDDTTDAVTITYPAMNGDNFTAISSVTDGEGKVYEFTYDSNYNLISATYKGTGTSNLDTVTYGYDSNNRLTEVNYNEEESEYEYTSTGLISSITAPDGYKLAYEYYDDVADGTYNPRVKKVTEYGSDETQGNYMEIEYDNNLTEYVDANGNTETIIFDSNGNVATTMDENGYAVHQKTDNEGNFLGSTNVTIPVINKLTNHSFENDLQSWTVFTSGVHTSSADTTKAVFGTKSAKLSRTTAGIVNLNQDFANPTAGNYTLSAYVFAEAVENGDGALVYTSVQLADGSWQDYFGTEIHGTSTEWERSTVSFTVPEGAQMLRVFVGLNGALGTAYFDAIQLEAHKRAYDYNLIENGDFANGTTSWSLSGSTATATDPHGGFDSNVIEVESSQSLSQTVTINGKADDSYTLSAWFKVDGALPFAYSDYRELRIIVIGANNDGSFEILRNMQLNPTLQDRWYKLAESIVLDVDYDKLHIQFESGGQQGSVFIDGVELFAGGFYDDREQTEDDTTTDDTIIEEDTSPEEDTPSTFTEDEQGRITSYTDEDGVVHSYTYANDYNYDTTMERMYLPGFAALTTRTQYLTEDGNDIVKEIDELGNTFSTYKSITTGKLTKMQDAKGVSSEYVYNALQQLTKVTAKSATGAELADNNYTYEHNRVKTIEHNGVVYTYNYNGFGDIVSIYIGSTMLISYQYKSNTRRVIETVTYGNGTTATNVYNDFNQVIQTKLGNTPTYGCEYDEIGNVICEYDYVNSSMLKTVNGETQEWSLDGTVLKHSYKNSYIFDTFVDKIGNSVYNTSRYTDENNNKINVTEFGMLKHTNEKDIFSRTKRKEIKNGDNLVYYQQMFYKTNGAYDANSMNTTRYIESTLTSVGDTTISQGYSYDANGNITEITRGTEIIAKYYYDSLNQLTSEFDFVNSKFYGYTYNAAGNIENVNVGDFTYNEDDESISVSNVSTTPYSYGNTSWKDQLTGVGTSTYTYDGAGNMTSNGNWSYSWGYGNRMTSATNPVNNTTVNMLYNKDGLRTQKTVNGVTTTYKWADGKLTYQSDGTNTLYFYYDSEDELLGVNHNGIDYIYVKNIQGDIIGIATENGVLMGEYTYNAWGKLTNVTGITGQNSIMNVNPMRYRGYYYDNDLSMYYLNTRYYSQELKRFISADSMMDIERGIHSHNMYAYCENNPVVRIDSNGESWVVIVILVAESALMGMALSGDEPKNKYSPKEPEELYDYAYVNPPDYYTGGAIWQVPSGYFNSKGQWVTYEIYVRPWTPEITSPNEHAFLSKEEWQEMDEQGLFEACLTLFEIINKATTIKLGQITIDLKGYEQRLDSAKRNFVFHSTEAKMYDLLAVAICERYQQITKDEFDFNDSCVANEIKWHVNGYMSELGYKNFSTGFTHYLSIKWYGLEEFIRRCEVVNIAESDRDVWYQNFIFGYDKNMR